MTVKKAMPPVSTPTASQPPRKAHSHAHSPYQAIAQRNTAAAR
jgi:hypothetical protein